MIESDFKGKKILITGASKGIGFELACALDKQGAHLLLHSSGDEGYQKLINHFKDGRHSFWQANFFNPGDLEESLESVLAEFGALDGFVNCVGVRLRRPVNLLNVNLIQDTLNANFTSYLELIRLVTKKNRFNPGLSILSISSISAHAGAPGVSIYAASKGAIESATRCLAKELYKKQIRINTIVSGQVNTDAYEALMESSEKKEDPVLLRQYMGLLEPQIISDLCLFLLSEKSKFINGTSFPADAGFLQ